MRHKITGIVIGLFVTMSLLTSSILAQSSNEVVVPLSNPAKRGKLKAHLNAGSITVKGTARKDVVVKYNSEGNNNERNKEKIKDGLHRISGGTIDLEVSENDNFIKVGSESMGNELNLEIEVPSEFDLEISTYNEGDIVINMIQGELDITNYNGSITALNISGSVLATTFNGDVKVTFDKVTDGSPMSYSTFNGDIDLTLPAATKATLKMKTEQGEIFTGFEMAVKDSGPVQKKDAKSGVYKVTIDEWKRGDINGGGAEITMKNYNGDIYVRKK